MSLHAILTEVTADFPHQCVMAVAAVDLGKYDDNYITPNNKLWNCVDEKEENGDSDSEKSVDAETVTTFQFVPDSVQKRMSRKRGRNY